MNYLETRVCPFKTHFSSGTLVQERGPGTRDSAHLVESVSAAISTFNLEKACAQSQRGIKTNCGWYNVDRSFVQQYCLQMLSSNVTWSAGILSYFHQVHFTGHATRMGAIHVILLWQDCRGKVIERCGHGASRHLKKH